MTASAPPGVRALQVGTARRWLLLALAAVAVLAPLALAAVRWPSYWLWIASEQTPMTWLQSVVLLLALVGLAALPLVLCALAPDPVARRALLVGVVLSALAVGTDSIDPSTWSIAAERLQQSLEEVVELAAGLCFLGAVVLRLLGLLDQADR